MDGWRMYCVQKNVRNAWKQSKYKQTLKLVKIDTYESLYTDALNHCEHTNPFKKSREEMSPATGRKRKFVCSWRKDEMLDSWGMAFRL